MWEEILRLAIGNGLWAVLFCLMLFLQIKDSKKREEKYVGIIRTLSDKLGVLESVKEDTEAIRKRVAVASATERLAQVKSKRAAASK
jgi:hypothetical protein